MQESSLIKICRKLSKKEWKLFGDFMRSPYFNTYKPAIRLFEILQNEYPSFDKPKKLKKEVIYQKLYSDGSSYNKSKLHSAMFQLKKQVDVFIIQEALKEQEQIQNQLRLFWLQNKDDHQAFELEIQEQIRKIEKKQILSADDHKSLYSLLHQWQNHPQTQRQKIKKDRLFRHFTHATVTKWLSLIAEFRNRSNILPETPLIDDTIVLNYILRQNYFYSHSIRSYVLIIRMYRGELNYHEVKSQIIAHWSSMDKKVQYELWIHLLNQAGFLNRQGEIGYLAESWELYEVGIKNDLITDNKRISDLIYVNMIAAAAVVNKIETAKQLSQDYKSFLKPQFRKYTVALAQAYIYFYKGKWSKDALAFEECVKKLDSYKKNRVPIVSFTLRAHCIRLRAMYDLQYTYNQLEEDILTQARSSFDRFLSRNKNEKLVPYRNFYNLIGRLSDLAMKNNKFSYYPQKKIRIKADIKNMDNLLFRGWLMEKAEALK